MTLDNILTSLFPNGHDIKNDHGLVRGSGLLKDGRRMEVIGVADWTPIGVDEAIRVRPGAGFIGARG